MAYVQQILKSIGVDPERVAMYNLSAGMGPRFAEIVREMTEKVRQLGPLKVGAGAKAKTAVA